MKKPRVSKREIKNLGIWLIIFGIIHVISTGLLSASWGIILIIFGIYSVVSQRLNVLLIFGILIIIAGLMNLISSMLLIFLAGEEIYNYLWLVFGGFQVYWGTIEILKYQKIKGF